MSEHLKQLFASAREALRPLVPQGCSGGVAVGGVPGSPAVIGFSTRQPGLSLAGLARQLDRAFLMRNARASRS